MTLVALLCLLPTAILPFAPVIELGVSWYTADRVATYDNRWLDLLFSTITQALLFAAWATAQEGELRWRMSLWKVPRLFFRVLLIEICVVIATLAGALLLIVPGIIVFVGFSLAEAFATVDGLGVLDSLEHSWVLSRGHRWRLLVAVALPLLAYAFGVAVFAVIGVSASYSNVSAEGWVTVHAVCTFGYAVVDALFLSFSTLIYLAVHRQLREPSAPIDAAEVAKVFA
ncbi:MAG: hypothetical protein JJ863_22700 [Deltaproteobacteria bacterium]|nr:hypothetical protein [Deltaproteobacteria bacterium]